MVEKTNLYILSIVGIVALVGIVVMFFNGSFGSVNISDSADISGQAISVSKSSSSSGVCTDTDGGINTAVKGTIKGKWYTTDKMKIGTDFCSDSSHIYEYACHAEDGSSGGVGAYAYYSKIACESDEFCNDGACIPSIDLTLSDDAEISLSLEGNVSVCEGIVETVSNFAVNVEVPVKNQGLANIENKDFYTYITITYNGETITYGGHGEDYTVLAGETIISTGRLIVPNSYEATLMEFLTELYTGSASLVLEYQIDNQSSAQMSIVESDETNNDGSETVIVSSRDITFNEIC